MRNLKTVKNSVNFKNLAVLIKFFTPYKKEVWLALLALLVTAVMILFFGKAIKYLIDFGFAGKSQSLLNMTLLIFTLSVIAMAIAGYYRALLINSTTEKVIADIRRKVYNHIIRRSAEFFEETKIGDIISRLTVDTAAIQTAISNTFFFAIRNGMLLIGSILFLIITSPKLTLVAIALLPIIVSPMIFLGKAIKELSLKTQVAVADVSSHIEETINGIKTIQAYLCEDKELKNFSSFVDKTLKTALQKIRIKSLLIALVIALAFGAVVVVLWFGGNEVLSGKITSGDLSSFIFYSIITATSLVSLSQISGSFQSAMASCDRIFQILELESVVKESENPKTFLNSNEVNVQFKDVFFAYPSRKETLILENFNFNIKAQEKIAIIGLSGSGKSTILQLLLRFYDVNSGEILINNTNIKDISLADLRQNFAYISQDCFIFSGTIFENIAYANKDITKEQVQQIIAGNEALQFINKLPNKLDSEIGQKGIQLSGGERQRIAIARAIIKDSPILLLDEATSALDSQNEKSIFDAIALISQNKTVITISHNLSEIASFDKIIFINDGKISQIGSHAELIAKNEHYQKIHETN